MAARQGEKQQEQQVASISGFWTTWWLAVAGTGLSTVFWWVAASANRGWSRRGLDGS